MNTRLGCQNASSSANRLPFFTPRFSNWTLPVLVLLALLCSMTATVFAQTAVYGAGQAATIDSAVAIPMGITTDASGNIFVVDNGTVSDACNNSTGNPTVCEMQRTGVGAYGAPIPLPGGFTCAAASTESAPCLRGIAVDASGNVWVAGYNGGSAGKVYELSPTAPNSGTYTAAPVSIAGPLPSGWSAPWGVAVDPSGNVFVSDNVAQTVVKITGGVATTLYTGGSPGIQQPRGIAVDSSDDLFVVDGNVAAVAEEEPPYTAAQTYVSTSTFSGPGDLARDANGNFWVSEFSNSLIRELTGCTTATTTTCSTEVSWGPGLKNPTSVWPDSDGSILVSDNGNSSVKLITLSTSVNFTPSLAVGSTSSSSQTVTFTFTGASTTIGGYSVLAPEGASGQDFADAGGATCTTAGNPYATGATCSVTVNFTPKRPGARGGAVVLFDATNVPLATAYLSGTGTGPELIFDSPYQTTSAPTAFTQPQKIAVDGSGNIFVADGGISGSNEVFEISGGVKARIASGCSFSDPWGIAIDGAGNLFVANAGSGVIQEIFATGGYATCQNVSTGFAGPLGVAIDTNANLYVADANGANTVYELTAATGYAKASATVLSTGFAKPFGVAVDGSGNVFVADIGPTYPPPFTTAGDVYEIPAGTTSKTAIGSGWQNPSDVATDAAGNVYVADEGAGTITQLMSPGFATPATPLVKSLMDPSGVTVDTSGNVYYTTNGSDNSEYELNLVSAPTIPAFALTQVGQTSSDSPKSVTLDNIGNSSLSLTVPAFPTNFPSASGTSCANGSSSLGSNGTCELSFNFIPTTTGSLSGSMILTDNSGSGTTQTINLSGSALDIVINCASCTGTTMPSGTVNASYPAVTFTATGGTSSPAAYTWAATGFPTGTMAINTTTGVVSGTPTATLTAGTITVSATDSGTGGSGAQVSKNFTLTINGPVTATQAIASEVLTQNHLATPFTPVTGSGGTAPLTYSVLPALPSGLLISATTGQITGTPTVVHAASSFTVTVTDSLGATASNTFSLTVNTAVTATQSIATEVLTENHAATPFTPVTGGGGTAPLAYSIAPALPTGLLISATTGQITGTPTVTLASTTFTVTVTDANSATATNTFSLTVNGAVAAAQSVATIVLTVNHAAVPVTPVTGSGGTAPLSYGVAPALPSGLLYNTSTGQITGTPTVTLAATTFTVTVTDANSATATNTFSLTVNSAVTATQSVASTVLTQNHLATPFTPVTGGGGTAPLSYGVTPALPTGLSISSTTGQITGTPTVTLAATTFTVTVTDANGATATNTFSLTVNTAVTATQSIASEILTENHLATPFTPVTGGGGTAPLTYAVAPALPTGLTLSTTTGQITGTPTVVHAASSFTVTVTDANGATATNTFSLTVNSVVTATQAVPTVVLTINHAAVPVTPVTGSGGTAPLTYGVAPALPAGLTMSTTTGQITGTPTVTSAATTYTVTVTDANSATATATFSLTVNSAVTATTSVASTVLTQNHAATPFTPVTGGGGTAPLSYGVAPALPAGLTMSTTTGQVTGTPTVALAATTFTVTVTDANGATATATFSLTVNGALSATTAIASTTLTDNHAATPFTPVTGSGGTAPLTYGVAPALPTGLTMSTTTGQITGTPTVVSAATTYTVTVTDANSATATATFSLTVSGAVTATTAIASTVLTQNRVATPFTPVTGAGGTAPLSYAVAPALPAGLTMSSSTGQITGTPTVVSAATTYTVTVTDANSATATATFSLTVNTAVTATTAIASTVLTENHAATPFTPVTGAGGTSPLHYGVAPALPAGLTLSTTTGQITGTPTVALAATTFTVTVTDANGATATATFSLTVNGVVTATTAVATTVLTENHAATPFTPVTGSGGTAPLTYSVAPTLPAGLTMSTTTGQITGTPTATLAATTFTVTVTDANSATATATFGLTVNGALTATTAVATTTLLAEQVVTPFTPVTGSGGTAPLSYSVAPALPAGLTLSSTTGQITGTPTVTSNATTYTVTVTDANSATATATFSLTVSSAGITINWANPTPITYGTSLAGVLNATATYQGSTVPGTFVYTSTPGGPITTASILAAGSYTLTANFTPTDTTKYSTPPAATVPLTVNQAQPAIAWAPATTISYGTSLSALLNATVSFGGNPVAGTFAYSATPTGGAASPVTSSTVLPDGTYTLTATFTPTDTTDYKTASATSPLTVTSQSLTVKANNATRVYGTANPTFTGTVTGAVNGDTFTESFSTTATTTSNVGTYPIVPSVTGANLSDYTVVIDDGTLTVTQAGTTTSLIASAGSVNPGASLTLTATVVSATTGTPTGTVTFYDGSTTLGTGTLAAGANGDVATFSTTTLTSGTHTITAVYGGDTNFTASSTSSSVTVTVAPLGLTMSATPASQTGNKGTTFTYNLAVAPAFAGTAYPGTVSFAATGGPTGAVFTFTPSTLAANAGPETVGMTIATSSTSSALQPLSTGTGRRLVPVAFALFLLPLAGTRRMRRNGQRFGRFVCLLLLALAGVAATTALSGCGSSAGGSQTVPKGTQYTITVTATSGSASVNSTVTLTLE